VRGREVLREDLATMESACAAISSGVARQMLSLKGADQVAF